MFRGVLVILAKIQDSTDMKFVLKKKNCSKNQNKFAFCKLKTSKGKKKKWKEEINKGTYTAKKINRIEKFEIQNLRRGIAALVLVEDTEVTNKEKGKT